MMSDLLPSRQHPDADQLNAFVEHVLPPHEHQEMLAHLTLCPDCRAIVALALPLVNDVLTNPEPLRYPRYTRWRLLWPVAAAATLAVLLLATLHQRNVSHGSDSTRLSVPVAPQVALNRLPPAPAPIEPAAEPPERKAAPSASVAVGAAKPRSPSASPAAAPSHAAPPATASAPAGTAGVAFANGLTAVNQDATALPAQTPHQPVTMLNNAPYAAPPVVAGSLSRSNQSVSGLAMVDREARRLGAPDFAQAILRTHPLPSGLPALSTASNLGQSQTLAIDTNGALFLTADSGAHWTSVTLPWQGRALKVDLAYPVIRHAYGSAAFTGAKRGSQIAPGNGSVGGPVSLSSGILLSTLSGTVTDVSGAIIPGATVIVSTGPDARAPQAQQAKTDAAGRYLIAGLAPGTYTVEAASPGFLRQRLPGVAVVPERPAIADLSLPVRAAAQTVEVTSANPSVLDASPPAMKASAPAKVPPSQPVFKVTTDSGEQWLSSDGLSWNRQ